MTKFVFTIDVKCVRDDGIETFTTNVAYKNMDYEDVVLVEGALIKTLESLNKYAQEVKIPEKKKR